MVNEVRTILLNLRPAAAPPPAGEEYVPADYRPAVLPPALAAARAALFGAAPTRAGLNLLVGRLLAYLHSSPLAADVTAGDARITYDPARPAAGCDPDSSAHAVLAAADGCPGAATLFRPARSAAEARWADAWADPYAPPALRAGALALALAARTADVRAGTYDG